MESIGSWPCQPVGGLGVEEFAMGGQHAGYGGLPSAGLMGTSSYLQPEHKHGSLHGSSPLASNFSLPVLHTEEQTEGFKDYNWPPRTWIESDEPVKDHAEWEFKKWPQWAKDDRERARRRRSEAKRRAEAAANKRAVAVAEEKQKREFNSTARAVLQVESEMEEQTQQQHKKLKQQAAAEAKDTAAARLLYEREKHEAALENKRLIYEAELAALRAQIAEMRDDRAADRTAAKTAAADAAAAIAAARREVEKRESAVARREEAAKEKEKEAELKHASCASLAVNAKAAEGEAQVQWLMKKTAQRAKNRALAAAAEAKETATEAQEKAASARKASRQQNEKHKQEKHQLQEEANRREVRVQAELLKLLELLEVLDLFGREKQERRKTAEPKARAAAVAVAATATAAVAMGVTWQTRPTARRGLPPPAK